MPDQHAAFEGAIPANYDRYLGPFLFAPYAADLAARVVARAPRRVLETACGTGIVTSALRGGLAADAHLVATDLNSAILESAESRPPMRAIVVSGRCV